MPFRKKQSKICNFFERVLIRREVLSNGFENVDSANMELKCRWHDLQHYLCNENIG